jgi:uncharacterized protein
MNGLYGEQHRRFQQDFDTVNLADRAKNLIVSAEVSDEHKAFIESRDMFFLTTIDHRGYPTCSHKGGMPGFVRVLDDKTLVFPSYDGNGMFLSLGNISGNPKVGMLFIDFETPHRVRVHGNASISQADDPLVQTVCGAELLVRVVVEEIFVNCPRYIHAYQRQQFSQYTPQEGFTQPLPPQWKRIDAVQDALPTRDSYIAEQLGTITLEQYSELVMQGKG